MNNFVVNMEKRKGIFSYFHNVKTAWQEVWMEKRFKNHFFLTLIIFTLVIRYGIWYINIWETRKGTHLVDPFLNILTPKDLSLPIFILIQTSLFISFFLLWLNPKRLLIAFQAYSLLFVIRVISIYFVPLEPPAGMIYLKDPFISFFVDNINVVTKDLFFSGHISGMCLFIYFSENKIWKRWMMFVTPIISIMILWQHVHYTVDIIVAPFFGFACSKLVEMINERWEYGLQESNYSLDYEEIR